MPGLTYKKGATTLGTLTYTRTNAALLATATPSAGAPGTTDTYTYSARAELTSRDNSGTNWTYDTADRITTLTGGTTVTYDAADEPTVSTPTTGPTTTYTYDNRGNRTASKVTGASSSTTYTYDQAGNLTSYTPAGGSASTYGYDGDGPRANKTPAGGMIAYMAWDTVSSSVALLLNDYSSSYVYGPGDTPVEQIKGTNATYAMGDQLGSTIILTSASGATTAIWTYDAYGVVLTHVGTDTVALLYNGQYQDAESGLYYLRARYYDPTGGQLLSVDPLSLITRSRYGYAVESPVNNSDPSGRSTHGYCLGGSAGWGPFASLSLCMVDASDGSAALTGTLGLGGGFPSAGVTGSIQNSTGGSVQDLSGGFASLGLSAGELAIMDASGFVGSGSCGQSVFGYNFGAGYGGVPFSPYGQGTGTKVVQVHGITAAAVKGYIALQDIFNPLGQISNAASTIAGWL